MTLNFLISITANFCQSNFYGNINEAIQIPFIVVDRNIWSNVASFETEVASKFKLNKLRSEDIERFYDKVGLSKLLRGRTKP